MTGVETTVSVVVPAVLTLIAALVDAHRSRGRPEPTGRPIEEIVADVRRISSRYHLAGMRFAKYEGWRRSYDQVLAEAADTLEIAHLLQVLPPGGPLDAERERVEDLLTDAGVLPRA